VSAACEPEHSFSLFVAGTSSSSNSMLPLSGDLTLGHINDRYWKSNKPLELFYMLDRWSYRTQQLCFMWSAHSYRYFWRIKNFSLWCFDNVGWMAV